MLGSRLIAAVLVAQLAFLQLVHITDGTDTGGLPPAQFTGLDNAPTLGSNPGPQLEQTANTGDDETRMSSSLPRLTRLSFSDLQHASSNSYTSRCCDIVPELCTPAGRCALNVSDCVSFCICARNPALHWCPGELQRLREVLKQRREHGTLDGATSMPSDGGLGITDGDAAAGSEAGLTEGGGLQLGGDGSLGLMDGGIALPGGGTDGDSDSPSLSFPTNPQPSSDSQHHLPHLGLAMGSLSLSDLNLGGGASGVKPGMTLGSLNLGHSDSGPSDDEARASPAQLASALASLGSLGPGDVTGDSSDALSGDSHQRIPPVFPMMNSGGSGLGGRNDTQDDTEQSDKQGGSSPTASGNHRNGSRSSSLAKSSEPHPHNIHTNISNTDSNNNDIREDAIPWWPDDPDSCGSDCALNGGRCVFDFNRTYTQVCVHDSVQPCHKLNCVHGTCSSRNGSYSCECEVGWTGIFCSKRCEMNCGDQGTCVVMAGETACRCQHNYTGVYCDELKPTPSPGPDGDGNDGTVTSWKIAAGCLGMAAALLLILLLAGYVTWRYQWLPMRKFVYYFQHYEEDDGKEYDAFVSYRSGSRDEQFVLHELYPQLERHLDFKLCMHFRDFPPGETIADNIIQAIENSRRTILILSPAYIQSEWCRLEYQKAQHEMLKLRHKIIPVMLDDVTHLTSVDRNLQTILDTVTYIRWPGEQDSKSNDKFWKLLQLSMPKRKSDYSRSMSSTGSCSSDRPLTAVSGSCFNNVVCSMSDSLYPQRSLSITSSFEVGEEEEEEGREEREMPIQKRKKADSVKSHDSGRYSDRCRTRSCESDNDNSDSGCLRDRASSSESDPDPPCRLGNPSRLSPIISESHHMTSDDHIVEIREFPGDQVKVTPWVPARFFPNSNS